MEHRSFRADDGNTWDAWPVLPMAVERRVTDEHESAGVSGEERRRRDVRLQLPRSLESGWLAFQHGYLRRRLVPVPEAWDLCSDAQLLALWRVATPVGLSQDSVPWAAIEAR